MLTDDLAGAATLTSGDAATPRRARVGETWVYSATYDATQADINAGTDLVNTATVVTTEVPGPTEDDADHDDHAESGVDGRQGCRHDDDLAPRAR